MIQEVQGAKKSKPKKPNKRRIMIQRDHCLCMNADTMLCDDRGLDKMLAKASNPTSGEFPCLQKSSH